MDKKVATEVKDIKNNPTLKFKRHRRLTLAYKTIKDMENNKENKEQNKNNSNLDMSSVGIFSNDPYHVFLYKKTEKVTAAVYLVSNLFSDSEPLKMSLRGKVLMLLSRVSSLVYCTQNRQEEVGRTILLISELKSLLTVANIAGLLSQMNNGILQKELDTLITTIETEEKNTSKVQGYMLPDSFFDLKDQAPGNPPSIGQSFQTSSLRSSSEDGATSEFYKGQPKGHKRHLVLDNGLEENFSATSNLSKKISRPSLRTNSKTFDPRKDSRKTIIIELLKKDSNLTIKDFTRVLNDCSEKTIQRELLSLVAGGVLKKEGERRWSTYSLVL